MHHAAVVEEFNIGAAVLALPRLGDGAAERVGHGLEAVANAEDRHAQLQQLRPQGRCAIGVDRARTTRQHDGHRVLGLDFFNGGGVRNNLGINPSLTHATRNQLCVLRAEIHHEDWLMILVIHAAHPIAYMARPPRGG